jgi:hypothetical protein
MGLTAELAELSPAPDVFVFATLAARATVPPSKPVKAAVSARELFEIFITYSPFEFLTA